KLQPPRVSPAGHGRRRIRRDQEGLLVLSVQRKDAHHARRRGGRVRTNQGIAALLAGEAAPGRARPQAGQDADRRTRGLTPPARDRGRNECTTSITNMTRPAAPSPPPRPVVVIRHPQLPALREAAAGLDLASVWDGPLEPACDGAPESACDEPAE